MKITKKNIQKAIAYASLLREKLLNDPYRPKFHFATPGDKGFPGDPNAAFYANGKYHLMYLYHNFNDYYRYGHMVSTDLTHWSMLPDALIPDELDGGIFSGGAFVDDDGTVYVSYWALPVPGSPSMGGIRIAKSNDIAGDYAKWEKFAELAVPATEPGYAKITENGKDVFIGAADPSNIWKANGKYYMQAGALVVLNLFRDKKDSPDEYKGDWTELFSSDDLREWKHEGRFYKRKTGKDYPDDSEDDMCPSFLPLPLSENGGEFSDKYLQLFIAHNKGCQYYIGSYDPYAKDRPFEIESHGRMSWNDFTFFAPEALIAPDGRQIMWAWLHDDRHGEFEEHVVSGWAGVYSLPRSLWLKKDGSLGIAPISELRGLRYDKTDDLSKVNPKCCEVTIEATVSPDAKIGLKIYFTRTEYVEVYYDKAENSLVFNAARCVRGLNAKPVEKAPLNVSAGEKITLDIFVDRSVIEVFANDSQAITRRAFWKNKSAPRLKPIKENAAINNIAAWNIKETNLF